MTFMLNTLTYHNENVVLYHESTQKINGRQFKIKNIERRSRPGTVIAPFKGLTESQSQVTVRQCVRLVTWCDGMCTYWRTKYGSAYETGSRSFWSTGMVITSLILWFTFIGRKPLRYMRLSSVHVGC